MYDKFQQSPFYSGRCLLPFSSTEWWTFLFCVQRRVPTVQTVQKTVVPTGAVLGQCLRLALVVSASVRHPTLTRSTPSTSCVCHPSVALVYVWIFRPSRAGSTVGTCVSTAPVVELTEMSFTVPLVGCIIDATATVVTTCSRRQVSLTLRPQCAAGVFASRCRVVVEVSLLMVLTMPMTGKFFFNYFQYQEFVGVYAC